MFKTIFKFLALIFIASCSNFQIRSPSSYDSCRDVISIFFEKGLSSSATIESKLKTMRIVPGAVAIDEGDNDVFLLRLEDGTRGVFKPHRERHNDILAEVSAYETSKLFKFDMVPPTVLRTYQGIEGSFQHYIESARMAHFSTAGGSQNDLIKQEVLDYLISNSDRYSGNYLIGARGSIYSIDHGRAFNDIAYGYEKTEAEISVEYLTTNSALRDIRHQILNVSDEEILNLLKRFSEEKRRVFLKRLLILKEGIKASLKE